MDSKNDTPKKIRQISYSLKISNDLHSKINTLLELAEIREYIAISQQKWIIDAIRERLMEEEDLPPEQLAKGKYVSIRIDERLYEKIAAQVEKMKTVRKSYSKKQWIVEALHAKINRDANVTNIA